MRALRRGRGRAFDDLEVARAALLADPRCNGAVGVIGFCLGGGFALVLAGRPGWDAAVVNYGALPADLAALDGACPVVASYGGRDLYLRGAASSSTAALTERGVAHDVKEYPAAGHAFLNGRDTTPWYARADDPLRHARRPGAGVRGATRGRGSRSSSAGTSPGDRRRAPASRRAGRSGRRPCRRGSTGRGRGRRAVPRSVGAPPGMPSLASRRRVTVRLGR